MLHLLLYWKKYASVDCRFVNKSKYAYCHSSREQREESSFKIDVQNIQILKTYYAEEYK